MKTSKILWYGIAGIIAGLLIENKALIYEMKGKAMARQVKKKLQQKLS